MNSDIRICDSTLRDGNHALAQQIDEGSAAHYAKMAESARLHILEVGHGNGLGASSLQAGRSKTSDERLLASVREQLINTRLGSFILPGWGTARDLKSAKRVGLDIVRVGTHCTEATTSQRLIGEARTLGLEVHGCLLMSHMVSPARLSDECARMVTYGAESVGIMDSAGYYLPEEVFSRISMICSQISLPVIFHAHNNLGLAIANSLAAASAGAAIIDASIRGLGAGAGNAQLEALVPALSRAGYSTSIDLYRLLDAADAANSLLTTHQPSVTSESIVSGLAGVFSGFRPKVLLAAQRYGLDARDIFFELGRRNIIAGQEDLIFEVALQLSLR